jgi:hypothetical protein
MRRLWVCLTVKGHGVVVPLFYFPCDFSLQANYTD